MKNITLLLTGSIEAGNVVFTKRNNSKVRLNDYRTTIKKYRKIKNIKIVFVENSNYQIDKFDEYFIEGDNFELLQFDGRKDSMERGKGFGEMKCLIHAFDHSVFLKNTDYIIKCTGRNYAPKIKFLIEFLQQENYDVIGNFWPNLNFFDSRLFAFKSNFFLEFFVKYENKINDFEGEYFEHSLAKAIHESLSKNLNYHPLPIPLIVQGFSGTGNYRYDTFYRTLRIKSKFYLKRFINEY